MLKIFWNNLDFDIDLEQFGIIWILDFYYMQVAEATLSFSLSFIIRTP